MAETPETHEKSAPDTADIAALIDSHARRLHARHDEHDKRIAALVERLERIDVQAGSNGEQISKAQLIAAEVRDAVREIHELVRQAAPLLESRAVKAMRAGGSVLDYIRAGRGGD